MEFQGILGEGYPNLKFKGVSAILQGIYFPEDFSAGSQKNPAKILSKFF